MSKKKASIINNNKKTDETTVIGIGASAGGLEAIELLFANIPINTGLAFIIITHLNRTHTTLMPEIIKKYTTMSVFLIKEGIKIQPNAIYFLPPNANAILKNNTLHLVELEKGDHLPINFFFQSLAEDKKENAIAVILSGTGTDGTIGITEIKNQNGTVIVQDPLTAKYDGMPQSAINTGLVDYTLPVEKIANQLLKEAGHIHLKDEEISSELRQIFSILRTHTSHDFSLYKLNTISRRIEKQMTANHINTLRDYIKFLRSHPHEVNVLFNDLLIGVTRFFRDSYAFEILKGTIIPKLMKDKPEDYCIRVWVPGCSTGEEAYSVAIILREYLDQTNHHNNVQIFGTDIDLTSLEIARHGSYPNSIINDVDKNRLKQFFIKEKNSYRIKNEIREMVVFGVQNIIKDPPFTKLDLICCRNLLIYFNTQLQKKLLPIFHYSLKSKGILFLGTSESISGHDDLFRSIANKWKIFEKKEVISYNYPGFNFSMNPRVTEYLNPPYKGSRMSHEKIDMETINNFILDGHTRAYLVIDKAGNILLSNGRVNRYIDVNKKGFENNLFNLISSKNKSKFIADAEKAINQHKKININYSILEKKDIINPFKISLSSIAQKNSKELLLVTFQEKITNEYIKATKLKYKSIEKMSKRFIEIEDELQYTKESLQSTIEELQSSNEELQSTNEELQSTNEEIETSKEELQSLNEELVTVNSELQDKIDELASINDDMNNLFNSTEIAAIFLDNDLNIKRFTPKVHELINLMPSDIGRPLHHFAFNLKYDNFIDDIKYVLTTLMHKSFEVYSKNDKCYLIKILLYRTLSNIIDGVIITFTDITSHIEDVKLLNASNQALTNSLIFNKSILDSINESILVLSEDLKIIAANRWFYQSFKTNEDYVLGKFIYEVNNETWNNAVFQQKLNDVLEKKATMLEGEIQINGKNLIINIQRIFRDNFETNTLLLLIKEK